MYTRTPHARTHARTHVHQMHARTHARTHVHHMHARTHARTHARSTHARTHDRTHARTHTRTHTRMYTCMHTRAHARTHTHRERDLPEGIELDGDATFISAESIPGSQEYSHVGLSRNTDHRQRITTHHCWLHAVRS